jgi:hypothetical protein
LIAFPPVRTKGVIAAFERSAGGGLLATLLLAGLLAAPVFGLQGGIPPNASRSPRGGWICDDGFAKRGESCVTAARATDEEIRDQLVAKSIAAYAGSCPCPQNTDSSRPPLRCPERVQPPGRLRAALLPNRRHRPNDQRLPKEIRLPRRHLEMTYYVNKNAQPNGDHEVHKDDPHCPTPAESWNRHYLGDHATCYSAVLQAKQIYSTANGCAFCSPERHTT